MRNDRNERNEPYSTVIFIDEDTQDRYELSIRMDQLQKLFDQNAEALKTLPFNYNNPDDPVNQQIIPVIVAMMNTCLTTEIKHPNDDPGKFFSSLVMLVSAFRDGKSLMDFLVKH